MGAETVKPSLHAPRSIPAQQAAATSRFLGGIQDLEGTPNVPLLLHHDTTS